MTKLDFYYPSVDGKTQIHAIRWEPEGQPKAVLQIIHGMVEFIDRYDDFAKFLTEHGYLVVGEDHIGHGESVRSDEFRGFFGSDGNAWIIADIHQLRLMIHEEYPDVPYLMLGHSWGSFLVRQYITEKDGRYAEGLAGVIIMGTGWQTAPVLAAGKLVAKLSGIKKVGKVSKMIENMAFGSNLKKIENPRTISDWLTKDEKIVDWYRAHPWCTFHWTPNAYYHMFSGMQKAHDLKRMAKLPAGLPILITSGAEDPVGSWGEGVRKTYMAYSENSPCEVSIKIYEGDRHEILNETDRDVVYKDMLEFLDYCISK
ncbi:MAG: alpha/beta fold hydrolase [Mogibacterium sp.]|nr:alpha/beta fold hydrolase [Mogibacterium sp.]